VEENFSVTGDYMEVWCLAFAPTSVPCKHIHRNQDKVKVYIL